MTAVRSISAILMLLFVQKINKCCSPISIGDSSHLSAQSNLHLVQSKKGETEKAMELERKVREERKMGDLENRKSERLDDQLWRMLLVVLPFAIG